MKRGTSEQARDSVGVARLQPREQHLLIEIACEDV